MATVAGMEELVGMVIGAILSKVIAVVRLVNMPEWRNGIRTRLKIVRGNP